MPRVQNPALRHELSFEMSQMHSNMALYFGASDEDADGHKLVLPRSPGKSGSKVPTWHMNKNFV